MVLVGLCWRRVKGSLAVIITILPAFLQMNTANYVVVRNIVLNSLEDGNLLICENCPKVFHLKCIGLTFHPTDDFICPYCKGLTQSDCVKCYK